MLKPKINKPRLPIKHTFKVILHSEQKDALLPHKFLDFPQTENQAREQIVRVFFFIQKITKKKTKKKQ